MRLLHGAAGVNSVLIWPPKEINVVFVRGVKRLVLSFCCQQRSALSADCSDVLREEVYVKINILQDRHTQTQISVLHSCLSLYVFYGMHPELIQIHPK